MVFGWFGKHDAGDEPTFEKREAKRTESHLTAATNASRKAVAAASDARRKGEAALARANSSALRSKVSAASAATDSDITDEGTRERRIDACASTRPALIGT